jgi:Paf1
MSASRAGQKDKASASDFVARLRFWNTLPDVPLDPKLLRINTAPFAARVVQYNRGGGNDDVIGSNLLERSFQHPVPAGPSGEGHSIFRADLIEPQAVNPVPAAAAAHAKFQRLWRGKQYARVGVEQHELLVSGPDRQALQDEVELRFLAQRTLPQADIDLLFPPQRWVDEDQKSAAAAGAGGGVGSGGKMTSAVLAAVKGKGGPSGGQAQRSGSAAKRGSARRKVTATDTPWLLKGNLLEGLLNTSVQKSASQQAALARQAKEAAAPAAEQSDPLSATRQRERDVEEIEGTFLSAKKVSDLAREGRLQHPKRPGLRAVEVLEFAPDTARWGKVYNQVQFEQDPLPPARFSGTLKRVQERQARQQRKRAGKSAAGKKPEKQQKELSGPELLFSEIERELERAASAARASVASPIDSAIDSDSLATDSAALFARQEDAARLAAASMRRSIVADGILRHESDPTQDDEPFLSLHLPRDPKRHRERLAESGPNSDAGSNFAVFEWVGEFDDVVEPVRDAMFVALPDLEESQKMKKRPAPGGVEGCRVTRKARFLPVEARITLQRHRMHDSSSSASASSHSGPRPRAFPFARPAFLRAHYAAGLLPDGSLERHQERLSEVLGLEAATAVSLPEMTRGDAKLAERRAREEQKRDLGSSDGDDDDDDAVLADVSAAAAPDTAGDADDELFG